MWAMNTVTSLFLDHTNCHSFILSLSLLERVFRVLSGIFPGMFWHVVDAHFLFFARDIF